MGGCFLNSDSKCSFGRDWENSLKHRNRVPYCGENTVWPTQKPFQCGHIVADRPHFESLFLNTSMGKKIYPAAKRMKQTTKYHPLLTRRRMKQEKVNKNYLIKNKIDES